MDAEIYAEMEALVRDLAGRPEKVVRLGDLIVAAQAIVAKLPEPIDPDLLAAREEVAKFHEELVYPSSAGEIRRGERDNTLVVRAVLLAYKAGKASVA